MLHHSKSQLYNVHGMYVKFHIVHAMYSRYPVQQVINFLSFVCVRRVSTVGPITRHGPQWRTESSSVLTAPPSTARWEFTSVLSGESSNWNAPLALFWSGNARCVQDDVFFVAVIVSNMAWTVDFDVSGTLEFSPNCWNFPLQLTASERPHVGSFTYYNILN